MDEGLNLENEIISILKENFPGEKMEDLVQFNSFFDAQYSVCPSSLSKGAKEALSRSTTESSCRYPDFFSCEGFGKKVISLYKDYKDGKLSNPSQVIPLLIAQEE